MGEGWAGRSSAKRKGTVAEKGAKTKLGSRERKRVVVVPRPCFRHKQSPEDKGKE